MSSIAQLKEVVNFLNEYLAVAEFDDASLNGLQVEGPSTITRVGFAVDASLESFEKAKENHCELLIVHHGIFWKNKEALTGLLYHRVKSLVTHNLGLYAVHLPLDKHPIVGNNAQLAKAFGLRDIHDVGSISVAGTTEKSIEEFIGIIKTTLHTKVSALPFGPQQVSKVAICSGSGVSQLHEAIAAGCDTFVTGDAAHIAAHPAKEAGINVIFAGHYATETLGLKALASELKQRFGVDVGFIDIPTGL